VKAGGIISFAITFLYLPIDVAQVFAQLVQEIQRKFNSKNAKHTLRINNLRLQDLGSAG
jgi:hypothetical protein